MADADMMKTWALIKHGVEDTKQLIDHRQYNASMVKARQTLEIMVRYLAAIYDIDKKDLIDMIDDLYHKHIITSDTASNYHKIRKIGNAAVHDGNDNSKSAGNAYHMLSHEAYSFADRYSGSTTRYRSSNARRSVNAYARNKHRNARKKSYISPYDLLKLAIPILIIIIIIATIRAISKDTQETEPVVNQEVIVTTAAPIETIPETTPAPVYIYTASSNLNVRSAPSTDADIITTIESGTIINYIKDYDDTWAIIDHEGAEAYVASRYLSKSIE